MASQAGRPGPGPIGDPALERPKLRTDICRNIDLPAMAFNINSLYSHPYVPVKRPSLNQTGKEIELLFNAFGIRSFPTKTVHQYDVTIGNGNEKQAVIRKVWNANVRKSNLQQIIFDGNKLAWSLNKYDGMFNHMIDLDIEQGRTNSKAANIFRLVVRRTKHVNLGVLSAWLNGQCEMGDEVLEALNFLDHVMREHPSGKFLAQKRSFFDENGENEDLGNGVLAFKGVYQAIRSAYPGRLIVNIDVSNSCFWSRTSFMGAAMAVLDCRDLQHLMSLTKPIPDGHNGVTDSKGFYEVHRRLRKLQVQPHYRGCPVAGTMFQVKGLINANARTYLIDIKDKATGKSKQISVESYFKTKYNVILDFWELPMVEMTKKGVVYPMEVLTIHGLQKYPFKLNEWQTSKMIKYAASRPAERLESIRKSKVMLDHSNDPVLRTFGLQIEENMIKGKARLLPNPEIQFGGNQRHNPGTQGRWDLRGKKFYKPNKNPLECWGIGFFAGRRNAVNRTQVEQFADQFMKVYAGHGGQVAKRPHIVELKEDIGDAIKTLYSQTGGKGNRDPQLLLIIVPDKNSFTYLRIKKSCDCRWGVPSQVMQAGHVVKNNPQYISNVLMKVNAKLGGTTARVVSKVKEAALRPKAMIVGADVTHPTLGVNSPSMAALSVSADEFGGRYWGACEINGDRVEIIQKANIEAMFCPLLREWMSNVGQGKVPEYLYYFRDGVSEGQFQHVVEQEVMALRTICGNFSGDHVDTKFCVVVANKRHHIRAFPKPGDRNSADRNNNPLPGTLIEREVTSPFSWDFLLYSHIALQGTSRPVHYHVVRDDMKHKAQELENMIYDHCYQYMRSTTSVSLHPAVYYAHLIAARARHHENVPASSGPQSGPQVKMSNPPKEGPKKPDPRLMPMHGTSNRLPYGMWYI